MKKFQTKKEGLKTNNEKENFLKTISQRQDI